MPVPAVLKKIFSYPCLMAVAILAWFHGHNHLYPRGDAAEYLSWAQQLHAYSKEAPVFTLLHDLFMIRPFKPTILPYLFLPFLSLAQGNLFFAVTLFTLVHSVLLAFLTQALLNFFTPPAWARLGALFLLTLPWLATTLPLFMTEGPLLTYTLLTFYGAFLSAQHPSKKWPKFLLLTGATLGLLLRADLFILLILIPWAPWAYRYNRRFFFQLLWPLTLALLLALLWHWPWWPHLQNYLYWHAWGKKELLNNPMNQALTPGTYGWRILAQVGGLPFLIFILLAFLFKKKLSPLNRQLFLTSVSSLLFFLLLGLLFFNKDPRFSFLPFYLFFLALWPGLFHLPKTLRWGTLTVLLGAHAFFLFFFFSPTADFTHILPQQKKQWVAISAEYHRPFLGADPLKRVSDNVQDYHPFVLSLIRSEQGPLHRVWPYGAHPWLPFTQTVQGLPLQKEGEVFAQPISVKQL